MVVSRKCLFIVVGSDNILKLWMGIFSKQFKESRGPYRAECFKKIEKLKQNCKNARSFWKHENLMEGCAPALQVVRAVTRLTVDRALPLKNDLSWSTEP